MNPMQAAVLELARTVTGAPDLTATDPLHDAAERVREAVRTVFATAQLPAADTVAELAAAL